MKGELSNVCIPTSYDELNVFDRRASPPAVPRFVPMPARRIRNRLLTNYRLCSHLITRVSEPPLVISEELSSVPISPDLVNDTFFGGLSTHPTAQECSGSGQAANMNSFSAAACSSAISPATCSNILFISESGSVILALLNWPQGSPRCHGLHKVCNSTKSAILPRVANFLCNFYKWNSRTRFELAKLQEWIWWYDRLAARALDDITAVLSKRTAHFLI